MPGFVHNEHIYDSRSILDLDKLPKHLGIIGAGYIGLEFSSYFSQFGSKVTVFQANDCFLPREDAGDSHAVKERLEKLSIQFIFNANTESVDKIHGEYPLRLNYTMSTPGKESNQSMDLSAILVAIGRAPATEALNLEAAGVKKGPRGEVKVNDFLCTSQKHIFAVGDVKGGPQFTFISLDDYRIVLPQILGILEGSREEKSSHNRNQRPIYPNTTFIDPPYSRIGLSESEAREKYPNIKIRKMLAAGVPKAQVAQNTDGFLKVIIDKDADLILGAILFCHESHEMINLFTLAMNENIPSKRLSQPIYNHPVMSEALNELLD